MLEERTIQFRALTPIWTGNADRKSDQQTLASGLIGSLRWWMEAIARGAGADIPDPTEEHATYDESKKPHGGLDPVSHIFGATGWRRLFRLEVLECGTMKPLNTVSIAAGGPRGASRWYYPPPGARIGAFKLRLVTTAPEAQLDLIEGLLGFIAERGSLGAKGQLGCGVIEFSAKAGTREALRTWCTGLGGAGRSGELPSLGNMFFARVQPKPGSAWQEETFWIKHSIRRAFADRNQRHSLMGTVAGAERIGAKIQMSLPYISGAQKEIRVCGWVPDSANRPANAMAEIKSALGRRNVLVDWQTGVRP